GLASRSTIAAMTWASRPGERESVRSRAVRCAGPPLRATPLRAGETAFRRCRRRSRRAARTLDERLGCRRVAPAEHADVLARQLRRRDEERRQLVTHARGERSCRALRCHGHDENAVV